MNHWSQHAPQWSLIGPPLRPGRADIAEFETKLPTAGEVLVLGITPEIITMAWPSATRLLAIDCSADMIRHNCPTRPGLKTLCADWRALPLPSQKYNLAIGDGSFNVMAGEADQAAFRTQLHRVLRPDGRLLLRVFIRPDQPESPTAIVKDLRENRIESFHAFKWRLAMALHGTLAQGVALARIWQCWHELIPDAAALMRDLQWDERLPRTIDLYRDVPTRYTFPTSTELTQHLRPCFKQISRATQTYELADRCPIIEWQRL